MELINEKTKIYAVDVKQYLLRQRTTREIFRLPCTKERAMELLRGAIMAEVESNNAQYEEDDELTRQLEIFAEWITGINHKPFLILFGKCGNGKTTLIRAFQRLIGLFNAKDYIDGSLLGLRIVNAKDVVWTARESHAQWLELCRSPMLAIDDMGTEPPEVMEYGNILTPLTDLLYKRYDARLFTIISTNIDPAKITEVYGERIGDRLREVAQRIIFKNPSYRKR